MCASIASPKDSDLKTLLPPLLALAAAVALVTPAAAADAPAPAAAPAPATAAPGEALKVFGLQALRWGMSVDEAAKAMKALQASPSRGLEIADYVYSTCHFHLELSFTAGKLDDIVLTSDPNDLKCSLDIGGDMYEKYGPAVVMKLSQDDALLTWRGTTGATFARSLVDLSHGQLELFDAR